MDKCHRSVKGGAHDICLSCEGVYVICLNQIHLYLSWYGAASFILVTYCVSKKCSHFLLYLIQNAPQAFQAFKNQTQKKYYKMSPGACHPGEVLGPHLLEEAVVLSFLSLQLRNEENIQKIYNDGFIAIRINPWCCWSPTRLVLHLIWQRSSDLERFYSLPHHCLVPAETLVTDEPLLTLKTQLNRHPLKNILPEALSKWLIFLLVSQSTFQEY